MRLRLYSSIINSAPLLLSGCVGPLVPVHTDETMGVGVVEAAAKVSEIPSERAKAMQDLGEVVGYSCKNLLWDPAATPEAATHQLKLVAAQRGATVIAGLTCEEGAVSLAKNCWQSFTCKATAFR